MNPTPRSNAADGTSNQWTPGPWFVAPRGSVNVPEIYVRTGHPSRNLEAPMICDLTSSTLERMANARLIALAPEMAEALARFVAIRSPNSGKWTKAETDRSLAALESEIRAILARLNGEGGGV